MAGNGKNSYAPNGGRSAEERALERYSGLLLEKVRAIGQDHSLPWLTDESLKWPKGITGGEYNGTNALMLLLHSEKEGYKVPVFLTFEQVMGLNNDIGNQEKGERVNEKYDNQLRRVSVLKGARSFPVLSTKFVVKCNGAEAKINFADYQKLSPKNQAKYDVYVTHGIYNVFNIDQTNIRELRPELYNKIVENDRKPPLRVTADTYCFPAIDEIIKNNEWLCPIHLGQRSEGYSLMYDEISIPEKEEFGVGEHYYGQVLREMIRSTGNESCLNRFGSNEKSLSSPKEVEEDLIAELGSAAVMQKYGLTKYVSAESRAHLREWLERLEESPDFLKNVLVGVKHSVSMVDEKIGQVNQRMLANSASNQEVKVLYVTGESREMVSEFHLLDKESCDAVYKLLKNNLSDRETGKVVEVSRPTDKIVRIDIDCGDALDYVYDCLDSETLSKIVDCGSYLHGQKVENYSSFFEKRFTAEFEKLRNNSKWLKEQGIEGNVTWDLNFISTDGYHLAKAVTDTQCKLGALDCDGKIFLPFEDVGKDIHIERDLGYMTELRRRLLYDDGRVDGFGRIAMIGQPKLDADTGILSREFVVDSEAKGVFVLRPDDDIFELNFVLDLENFNPKEEHLLRFSSGIRYNEELEVYQRSVEGIWNLLETKDEFYPIRFINDKVNMPLSDYCRLEESHENKKQGKTSVDNRIETSPRTHSFGNNEEKSHNDQDVSVRNGMHM